MHEQIIKYKPEVAVITNQDKYNEFYDHYGNEVGVTRILYGDEGLNEISSHDDVNIVVAAIVGFQCLKPVIDALRANKTVIIANKEILVAAGEMIMSVLNKSDAKLLPVDSEHNALLQVLLSSGLEYKINNREYYESNINQLTITASGGPFIDLDISEFKNIKSNKLSHWLFGHHVMAVRLPACWLNFVTALVLWQTAAWLYGPKAGSWASLLWISLPAVGLGSFLISTDTPLLLLSLIHISEPTRPY